MSWKVELCFLPHNSAYSSGKDCFEKARLLPGRRKCAISALAGKGKPHGLECRIALSIVEMGEPSGDLVSNLASGAPAATVAGGADSWRVLGRASDVRSFCKMRCNPWRWLWGLIPIAMLSWITFNWERGNIEADLGQPGAAGAGPAGTELGGDGFFGPRRLLRGRAAEEAEPKRALDTVRKLWGVRVVDQRTDLMPKADIYSGPQPTIRASLSLSGHVPSEGARKSILSVAKANFPKARDRGRDGSGAWRASARRVPRRNQLRTAPAGAAQSRQRRTSRA